ncbi:Nn.00g062110.m01.CDS01 [Neocucurbitaria sp. VM-36]
MVHFEVMLLAVGLGYVAASSVTQFATPAVQIPFVTAAPELRAAIHPRLEKRTTEPISGQVESRPDLIGYITANSSTYATYCNPGYTWSSSVNYATCCAPGQSCVQITACVGESELLDTEGSRWYCLDGSRCILQTIFDEYPSGSPRSLILCQDNSEVVPTVLFRHFSTTESSSTQTSNSVPTTSSDSTIEKDEHKKSSVGVIAGAVVGAVVAMAAVVGILIWMKKRKAPRSDGKVQEVSDAQMNPWEEKQVQTGAYEWRPEAGSTPAMARPYEVLGSNVLAQRWHEMEGSQAGYEMMVVNTARR